MLLLRRKIPAKPAEPPTTGKAPPAPENPSNTGVPQVTTGGKTKGKTLPPMPAIQPQLLARRDTIAGSASDNHARTVKAKHAIEKQLKLISESYKAIDEAQEIADRAAKVIEAQLRLVNLKRHDDGVYAAELKEVFTRQSRTVDPKKFRAQVDADTFWASINVSIEQAKKLLTEKELNAMSDIVPAKMTGLTLSIKRVDAKKASNKS